MTTGFSPSSSSQTQSDKALHIVGVGASAGGLEALEALFRAVPSDSGMAFVVIQHLSPDFKSHMEELLARQTSIPVHRVENGMAVEPNAIYLIPAKKEMVISDGHLLLTERSTDRSLSHPIDQFFRSLASDRGRYAIGVVLSGTGSDGSRGVQDIHDAGGLVIAQDESSAKFDGMPLSAVATGKVDVVLPPPAIAEALVRHSKDGISREKLAEEDLAFGNMAGTEQIFHLLNRKYGIDFSQYKPSTVGRRISRRIGLMGLPSIDSYAMHLADDETALNELYQDLLIGVTTFFRDPESFAALHSQIISAWFDQEDKRDTLRIWVAACATGEEAYSLAILVAEEMRRRDVRVDVKIFATDAHDGSLQIAAKGFYSAESLSGVSDDLKARYFHQTRNGYEVTREIRSYIVFAAHNVISDAPFTQMDLVTCRNMLIYLQPAAQRKVLSLFHFALKSNGTLFLGPSESPGELSDEFKVIDNRWKIYQKRRDVRLPVGTRIPIGTRPDRLKFLASQQQPAIRPDSAEKELLRTYEIILSKKLAPSILVSDSGEMLHIFGGAQRFLKTRTGRQSNLLLDVIHESLRGPLSTAMHHAVTHSSVVRRINALFLGIDPAESVSISVEPIGEVGLSKTSFLIEFAVDHSVAASVPMPRSDDQQMHQMHQSRVETLETELRYSQENLQATIEEMETSNEELQAANEELIASNEELQSTNEELHSVNEELYTVNAEHQRRVEELAQANDDMDNLLATTRVGVIFLDDGLYIRRFTPEIARVFRLESQDTGRSIEHFANVLNRPSLVDDLHEVLRSETKMELKVDDRSGNPYLLRILPYRSVDSTGGLVMTLIDIKSLTDAEAEIRLQQLAMETAVNGIIITDPRIDGNPITYVNQGFLKLTGYEKQEVLGRNCKFLQGEATDRQSVKEISEALKKGIAFRVTLLNYRKNGEPFWNDLQITPVLDARGKVTHFVGVQHDVTEQMRAQQALKKANEAAKIANEAKSAFLATMSHELRTPMTAILGFADMLKAESPDPEYLEKVDTIKRNGTYLLALLNDILDLSKVEAGKLRFVREDIDVRSVMAEVESLMQIRAREMRVPLRFEFGDNLPEKVNADATRVRQILVNLISNALKFSDSGEVIVSTFTAVEEEREFLKVSVRDFGIGISEDQLAGLFTPFNQAAKPTNRNTGGTGLGLSISKRLAEGIGGSIEVESELGVGSCFTLSLPLAETCSKRSRKDSFPILSATNRNGEETHPPKFPAISGRILLADDRRDVWRVGKYFLEKCGADVTVVENGKQAVEAVTAAANENAPYSLILMDMQMPVMTGHEAVKELRKLGFELPIIALTADAMEGEREACIEMGCNEYFPKPIDGPKLMHSIAALIEQK